MCTIPNLLKCLILLLFIMILPLCGISMAADDDTAITKPRPIPRARWSEDWSGFMENAPLTSQKGWRPDKYMALGTKGDSYLSIGGEYRLAYELYDDADMGISDVGLQDAVQHRFALHGILMIKDTVRLFAQFGYARVGDREGGKKTIDETDLDIWQLFVDYRFHLSPGKRFVVRMGRQIIETVNVFITAGEAHNVRLYYDGMRIVLIDNDYVSFDAFAAEYVDYADGTFDMSGTDEYFWGLSLGTRLQKPEVDLRLYYMGWKLKDRQFEQGGGMRHDEQRHTLLLWINRPLAGTRQWGIDYYAAYQFGSYDDPADSSIKAFAAFGECKYALFPKIRTPIIGLKTSYFSGDSNPDDSELNTFYNPVFGTPYFGYARDIMPFNLIQVQPNVGYRFSERVLITFSHEFLWRADTDDGYYNSANSITARAGQSGSPWLGQQSQVAVNFKPIDNIIITMYLSRFFAGSVIKDAGGDNRNYLYISCNFFY
jgi:hypothetical protein